MALKNSYQRSWQLFDQAKCLTPLGTSTNTKAPRVRDREPAYFSRGFGCRLEDIDGNTFIDFRGCLGPITLGYDYSTVRDAMATQLRDGWLFSGPHPLEVDVAKQLVAMVPAAEQVRYLKTGGEAMAAAIKLARAHTGRDVVATCGYHGWLQTAQQQTGVPRAIQALLPSYEYGDLDSARAVFETHGNNVAALSLAGSYLHMTPEDTFPKKLAELAHEKGALLIIDEIVTGFRLAWGGWHEYYGVQPDLAVFGKGMANGMPISVYLGRRDIMEHAEGSASISSTFAGETLSLAAALAVMKVYRQEPVIEHLWTQGERFRNGLASLFKRYGLPFSVAGLGPCPRLQCHATDLQTSSRLQANLFALAADHGVLMLSAIYVSYSHKPSDIDEALQRLDDACRVFDPEYLPDVETRQTPMLGAAAMR